MLKEIVRRGVKLVLGLVVSLIWGCAAQPCKCPALRSRGYMYFLPLELWVVILVLVGLYRLAIAITRWLITRNCP